MCMSEILWYLLWWRGCTSHDCSCSKIYFIDLHGIRLNFILKTFQGPFGNWYFSSDDTNYQMGDQRNGLKWIHSHISKFNGDNDNITLGGASAGGRSVLNHMTHSASYDYFKNALTIGPAAIPYWKTSELDTIFERIYAHIRRVSKLTFVSN